MSVEAPPAPAAPAPAAVPAKVGSAFPPSTGEIKVIAPTAEPAPPPKPGSAKSRLFDDLRKRGKAPTGTAPGAPEPPVKPAVSPKPPAEPAKPDEPPSDPDLDDAPPGEPPVTPPPGDKPPEDKKKVNPWKLLDEHKSARAKLEQELLETKKLIQDPEKVKSQIMEAESIRKRNEELEQHMRFLDYSKSKEFQEKYEAPYTNAWNKAMSDLKDITVADPEAGTERAFTAQDMLELVNLPLPKARELANNVFGDFADDVMAQRKEIRGLFDAQARALEEARTKGGEWAKTQLEAKTKQMGEIQGKVAEVWKKANESALKDAKYGAYFTPIEGDEEGNQRLAKGFELVDRAFSENPMDPNLTPEQRESVVKRHAAMRNRAAAFGRLVQQRNKLQAEISSLKTELEQYRSSTPASAGGAKPVTPQAPASAKASVFGALHKLAK